MSVDCLTKCAKNITFFVIVRISQQKPTYVDCVKFAVVQLTGIHSTYLEEHIVLTVRYIHYTVYTLDSAIYSVNCSHLVVVTYVFITQPTTLVRCDIGMMPNSNLF